MARKMKDSGIEWIGEIPEGWEIKYFVQLFSQVKNKNIGLREKNLLSLSYGKIKQKSIETVGGLLPDNFEGYNIIDRNDIVLRLTDLQNDQHSLRVGLSPERGIITSAYCSIRVRGAESPNYLYYYLHTFDIAKGFYGMGSGVRQGLNWDGLKYIKILLPPQHEQDRISVFLNQKTLEIDSILSKTISSIEEYKKLKQAVITQAVTKGVRGEREMKPTDFTRWSEIPFDWNLKRVKSCIASISSGLSAVTDDANSEESGKFVLRTSAVSSGFFVPTEVKPVLKSAVNRLICPVEPDILIVSRMNTASMVGACAYVANNHPNTFLPDKLWKIKFLPSYHTKYMWYALNSVPAKSWFSELATGASSSMQNISINDFTSNYLPIPAFSEQKEIANYLDAKCAEIDKLIAKKEQLVKELEGYKKSLIYEVVTGKREV